MFEKFAVIILSFGVISLVNPSLLDARKSNKKFQKIQKAHVKRSIAKVKRKNLVVTSRPASKKPVAKRKVAPLKRKKVNYLTVKCRGRLRYGRYCVGRIIGPKIEVRSIRCPLGDEKIVVHIVRGLKATKRDSDLRPELGRFGQKDYIWFCPKSNYASFPEDFSRPIDKAKVKAALAGIYRRFAPHAKIPGWFRYQAAAAVYWARGKDAKFFGELFLRALWAAREERAHRYEQLFRLRAIAAMKVALRKHLYREAKRPTVAYLIAELYRQARRWNEALFWYEKALLWLKKLERKTKHSGSSLERVILMGQKYASKHDSHIFTLP